MPPAPRFKRPVSVLVVVASAAGEVLLLHRVAPAGFWQSVTGSLRWDEHPAAAARRELFEETGIDATPRATGQVNRFRIAAAWRPRYHPEASVNVEHVFRVRLPERIAVRLNPEEHVDSAWLDGRAALARASSRTDRAALKALLAVG